MELLLIPLWQLSANTLLNNSVIFILAAAEELIISSSFCLG